MLRFASHGAISIIAQKLTDSGYALRPKIGTPLRAAYDSGFTPINIDPDTSIQSNVENVICGTRTPNEAGVYCHDKAIVDISKLMGDAVNRTALVASTVVNPIIEAVVSSIETARKDQMATIGSVLEIVPDVYEDIWGETFFYDLVEPYASAPVSGDLIRPNVMPLLSNDDIMKTMKTGSARADEAIEKWITEVGSDFVIDVFRTYFVRSLDVGLNTGVPISPAMSSTIIGRKQAIAVFLLARGLRDNPPEGVEMSLENYNLMLASVQEQAGRALARVLEKRDWDAKSNRLVTKWPMDGAEGYTQVSDQAQLVVNNDVYQRWLGDGGSPEILFGAFVDGKENDYSTLIENGAKYKLAWARRQAAIRNHQRSNEFSMFVRNLRRSMFEQIDALAEEQRGEGGTSAMKDRLRAFLDLLSEHHLENPYEKIKQCVCRVMFPHLQVEQFLDSFNAEAKSNPDLEAREWALLATINLMVDWIYKQFEIVHVG